MAKKTKKPIKVAEVIEPGNLASIKRGATFKSILEEAGRAMDACEAHEIVGGGILFKATDGKWYTATIETVIAEANPDFVKEAGWIFMRKLWSVKAK